MCYFQKFSAELICKCRLCIDSCICNCMKCIQYAMTRVIGGGGVKNRKDPNVNLFLFFFVLKNCIKKLNIAMFSIV